MYPREAHRFYLIAQWIAGSLAHRNPVFLWITEWGMSMLNGWGGYVLTQADYVNVFFSHDEYVDFYAEEESNLLKVREAFKNPNAAPE